MREIQGKTQNTVYLRSGELTAITFGHSLPLEFLSASGGTTWLKWHDDCIPEIGGETSTPLPVGVAYYRKTFPKSGKLIVGMIAEADTTMVINIL